MNPHKFKELLHLAKHPKQRNPLRQIKKAFPRSMRRYVKNY